MKHRIFDATVFCALLAGPAWADGNDHFNAGIDTGRPGATGPSTSSTTGDVDHDNGRLTDSDQQIASLLTGGAWGTLVKIEGSRATFREEQHNGGYRYRTVEIQPPPAKPKAPAVARRAVPVAPPPSRRPPPAFDPPSTTEMGPANAPPLQEVLTPATPMPAKQIIVETPSISAPPLSLPERDIKKDTLFADLERALNIIRDRLVDEPPDSAPFSQAEKNLGQAISLAVGALKGAILGGWGLTARRAIEGAIGLAGLELIKDRIENPDGNTDWNKVARDLLSLNNEEMDLRSRVARHQTRIEIQRIIDANREAVREHAREQRAHQLKGEHGR